MRRVAHASSSAPARSASVAPMRKPERCASRAAFADVAVARS